MRDLSLHILDIAENSIRAGAKNIFIEIAQDESDLVVSIKDDGHGMDKETLKQAASPFFTTKDGKKTGLGLALFLQAAQATGGDLKIESLPGKGTSIMAKFRYVHPDMKPMGDIAQTLASLVMANSLIRFVYNDKRKGFECYFDSHKKKG